MKIAYCTNVRLPSERAHGHQIAHVCEALIKLGHAVTVFAPYRRSAVKQRFSEYYNVSDEVDLQTLGSFDPIDSPFLPGVLGLWVLNWNLRKNLYSAIKHGGYDLVYTRSPALLPALLNTKLPVVLELHQLPNRNRKAFVRQCKRCAVVACLTSPMKERLVSWGVPADKVIVEGDAVDLERFKNFPSKEEARKKIKLATDRHVVGYVGRIKTLGMEKGVAHIVDAVGLLKHTNPVLGLIVGGPESDLGEYYAQANELGLTDIDLVFTGDVMAHDVPLYLAACDILAMPFPDTEHYRTNMSPLKMFEYMAAERPIVTTDLPTIRDVLSEDNAYFGKPGSAQDVANAIERIQKQPEEAAKIAKVARTLVEDHTWEKRMERILSAATMQL